MSDLPGGWASASLADLGTWCGGGTPSKSRPEFWTNGFIPWVSPKDMKADLIGDAEDHITDAAVTASATNVVPAGSVLAVTRSGILRRTFPIAVATSAVAINQDLKALMPASGIDPRYVALYLQRDERSILHDCTKDGTTVDSIDFPAFLQRRIPIAPAPEQDRIVAAIDEQFSRLDAGVAALKRARQNLKRMRAAVLQAAITGKLISPDCDAPPLGSDLPPGAVIHSNPDLPPNWVATTIGAIARVTSGATPLRSQEKYWKDGSIPWITSTLVNKTAISAAREYVTQLALDETSVKLMPKGTLLVAMYGEGQTRGRCSELLIEATTNQACAAIVMDEQWEFSRPFIKLALTASYEANRRLSSGGVQPNLSVGIIKRLVVPLPPESEQRRICEEVAAKLSVIDQLDLALEHAEIRATHFRSATLAAAFSGRLTPQDPADEPASLLLERIAAERASSNGQKPMRGRKARAMREEVTA